MLWTLVGMGGSSMFVYSKGIVGDNETVCVVDRGWYGTSMFVYSKGIVGDNETVCVVDIGWYVRVQHVCI